VKVGQWKIEKKHILLSIVLSVILFQIQPIRDVFAPHQTVMTITPLIRYVGSVTECIDDNSGRYRIQETEGFSSGPIVAEGTFTCSSNEVCTTSGMRSFGSQTIDMEKQNIQTFGCDFQFTKPTWTLPVFDPFPTPTTLPPATTTTTIHTTTTTQRYQPQVTTTLAPTPTFPPYEVTTTTTIRYQAPTTTATIPHEDPRDYLCEHGTWRCIGLRADRCENGIWVEHMDCSLYGEGNGQRECKTSQDKNMGGCSFREDKVDPIYYVLIAVALIASFTYIATRGR